VKDCSQGAPLDIVSVEGNEKMVYFDYATFNPNSSNYPGHDAAVTAKMNSVQVVFLYRFVLELGTYFAAFAQMQQMLANSMQAATQVVQDSTIKSKRRDLLYNSHLFKGFKLDVSIASPLLYVPASSGVKDYLVLDLGHLSLKNNFQAVIPLFLFPIFLRTVF